MVLEAIMLEFKWTGKIGDSKCYLHFRSTENAILVSMRCPYE